jgi:hypothetical protein
MANGSFLLPLLRNAQKKHKKGRQELKPKEVPTYLIYL